MSLTLLTTMTTNSSYNAAHFERSLSTSVVDHTTSKFLSEDGRKDQNGNEASSKECVTDQSGQEQSVKEISCQLRNGHAENGVNFSEKIAALKVESNGLSTVSEEERREKKKGGLMGKPPLPKTKQNAGAGKQSWLLRLFESKMFDMSIAISYLFNSKEPGVQTYLG